jgi:signal transduction histidine kinase
MRSRSLAQRLPIAIAAVMVVLLAVLALLQWKWVGEVSAMERHRMIKSLSAAGSHFTDDFDREVTRAFLYFHPDLMEPPESRLDRVLRQYDRWNAETPYPRLVRDVFLIRRPGSDGGTGLEVLWPAEHRFVACPWPPELAALRQRLEAAARSPHTPDSPGDSRSLTLAADVPGLVINLGFPAPTSPDAGAPADPLAGAYLLVRLDQKTITGDIFPALTRRYFETAQGTGYALAVEDKSASGKTVFLSDPQVPAAAFGAGDLQLDMFRLRPFDELHALWVGHAPGGSNRARMAGPPRQRKGGGPSPGDRRREGVWRLVLKHRDGSLEDAVTAVRRRNLAISLGILALLAATMSLMMVVTQRAQRLARLQIEFVAGVTHELNTPLTAIRSAGQNLAAGVVAEPGQVRRYGNLIESEGRRLSDMVGQALELAGIQSGRRVYHPRPVEVRDVVDGALQDCRWLLQEKGIEVEKDVDRDLPLVLADPSALRRAIQNLVENAVKYGGKARWIGVRARQSPSGPVEITVADRGPGIRREELPHLFKPFFRGRDAAAGSVPGSGLGLSLVRHIAEAHGGRITVTTGAAGTPGAGGSAFTLHLPAEAAPEQVPAVEEPA